MSFWDSLQPASLSGIPFAVLGANGKFGRRTALHEYPFRDTPWAEDIGKSSRRFVITGFILENDLVYQGGDVIDQRDQLIAAVEVAGPKTLMHPTMGTMQVSLTDGITITEKWDKGKYFEITFPFVESGKRVFPSVNDDTGTQVQNNAASANTAVASDFSNNTINGEPDIESSQVTTAAWLSTSNQVTNDATNIFNMVAELPAPINGTYGRFFGGSLSGFMPSTAPAIDPTTTVDDLIAAGSAARVSVTASALGLTAAIASGVLNNISAAVQALVSSILGATVDPADGVRLLANLANFTPVSTASLQVALGNLFRRCAVISLALASSTYQPSSSNDAYTTRNTITGLLDNEINIAGNSGEDNTFQALRQLRWSVVADMNSKGAALPAITTFTFSANLPACLIALMLYRDASRETEIILETGAPHPAFQPATMNLLAS